MANLLSIECLASICGSDMFGDWDSSAISADIERSSIDDGGIVSRSLPRCWPFVQKLAMIGVCFAFQASAPKKMKKDVLQDIEAEIQKK